MQITDYKLEDLKVGDELIQEKSSLKFYIQGIIGNCILIEEIDVNGDSSANIYSYKQLISWEYKLIRNPKMNGDFEVGDYKDLPVVLYQDEYELRPVFLFKVEEFRVSYKLYGDTSSVYSSREIGKFSKIKGIEYKAS